MPPASAAQLRQSLELDEPPPDAPLPGSVEEMETMSGWLSSWPSFTIRRTV